MKQLTLLAALLSTFILAGYGQSKTGKANGKVNDGDQKFIQSATISLLKAKDSSIVKIAATDKNGRFEFENLSDGNYLVLATSVGYGKTYTPHFAISQSGTVDLGVLSLKAQSKNLKEVTVVSRKPLVEQRIDRTIVNVEASVTNVGNSALEVLEKAPGITVDKDGNISLKGKDGVMVLIDGRPSYLSGPDLANMLRSMQASQLDRIEILTNPPAKYDAAGNAGIIDIRTKKSTMFGYNGAATVGYSQGIYPRANESFNFNYRKNKMNWFTNLSHNYNMNWGALDIQRNFVEKGTKNLLSHFDQHGTMMNENRSYGVKLGFDYFANKKTTFGVVLNGNLNNRTNVSSNTTNINETNGSAARQTRANQGTDALWKNFSTNLNFRRALDTAGQELSADFDFIMYKTRNNNSMINSYYDLSGVPTDVADTLLGDLPQHIKIYSAKVDYLKPLKKGARFEAGLKTSFVQTDNNAAYDSILNGHLVHDYNRSNHFIYKENINAAYANISGPLSKKWNGQLGLRLENTISRGDQVTSGVKFNRPYTQLFPTAYLQYVANKNNSFVLNYGRRIRRPDYESLNPFIYFVDRYTYRQGNPDIKPQFSHNIELSHTYRNFLTTTLNYSRTNDIIQNVIEQNEERNETYIKTANIAKQRQFGISVSANNPLTKWWTNSFYVNVFNNRFNGIVNDTIITISATTLTLNGSQQFKFAKTWTAEVSGFFRTAGLEGVIRSKPMGMVSIGLGKQIMKGKGSVRLNLRDVFLTQRFSATSKYSNVDAAFQERRDSRVLNMSFTYRFNKGKLNSTPRRRANGTSEEQNRAGGGN